MDGTKILHSQTTVYLQMKTDNSLQIAATLLSLFVINQLEIYIDNAEAENAGKAERKLQMKTDTDLRIAAR